VIFLIRPERIYGKRVITYKGLLMGEVDGIEIDENNWTITQVDVSLAKDMEKLFDVKTGMMSKAIVPLPVSLMGPITADGITLNQEITDPKALLERTTTERQRLLHR
jgi:sporulation protein YlmC with PRC-barrel domain